MVVSVCSGDGAPTYVAEHERADADAGDATANDRRKHRFAHVTLILRALRQQTISRDAGGQHRALDPEAKEEVRLKRDDGFNWCDRRNNDATKQRPIAPKDAWENTLSHQRHATLF